MRLALVVLTYNRSDALLAVLRGLVGQCGPGEEVVVADDGSAPAQVQALHESVPAFACPVRHVWHPDVGFTAARARNLGALHAHGDYLVFLDGDCVPQADFVAQHRRLARAGCFVNGSRVLLSQRLSARALAGELDLQAVSAAAWARLALRGDVNKLSHLQRWPTGWRRQQREFRWQGIRSCNFGLWRSDFERVDGFDDSFQGWGHEDADLVLRLHNAGMARLDGFWATEVFHLWHAEHSRSREGDNRQRVLDRQRTGQVRASAGLRAAGNQSGIRITELSSQGKRLA